MHEQFEDFYQEVKKLYTTYKEAQFALAAAEEFGGKKYVVPIVNEFRAALHHIMEAFHAFEVDPTGQKWRTEFLKATEEHLLRAIFDSYDLSINLQLNQIKEGVKKYRPGDRALLFPEYSRKIRPFIDKAGDELAHIRTDRDSKNLENIKRALIKTRQYKLETDRALEDLENNKKIQRQKKWIEWIISGIIGGVLGYLLSKLDIIDLISKLYKN